MPTNSCSNSFQIPYHAVRLLRGFPVQLQESTYRHLEEICLSEGVTTVTQDHLQRAIGKSVSDYMRDQEMTPDPDMIAKSRIAIREGRLRSIAEAKDAIRRKIA